MSTPLKAGHLVYRVVEVETDPPDILPYTWKVDCVTVESATARQISLQRHFVGGANRLFKPSALGSIFFETPLQAIQFFLTARLLELESLAHKKTEAARAIAWAAGQEGMP